MPIHENYIVDCLDENPKRLDEVCAAYYYRAGNANQREGLVTLASIAEAFRWYMSYHLGIEDTLWSLHRRGLIHTTDDWPRRWYRKKEKKNA